ncbi:uncharacterized protein LOC121872913 [Homarus americanus]|uniref:Uncharacterized protein n=1 Tax=Homarus americanus TaxID=6706 RepID=A0A8J5MU19_HOMAM|nr:uncharacterized protein LOC121872913 [Homarus americanus]KAG7163297.1 hypothetical protein Hamer_G004417 [Homarus americanus]
MYCHGVATTTLAFSLAFLASVSAVPTMFVAYNGGENSGQPTTLHCVPNTDGATPSFTCRPLSQEPAPQGPDSPIVEEVEEEESTSPGQVGNEEDQMDDEALHYPGRSREHVNIQGCGPHMVYVAELNMCEEVVHHLIPPTMSDPRMAVWFSWYHSLLSRSNNPRPTSN